MSEGCGGLHLSSLVLGDLVLGVLVALLALAVRLAGLGNVDLLHGNWSALVHAIQLKRYNPIRVCAQSCSVSLVVEEMLNRFRDSKYRR